MPVTFQGGQSMPAQGTAAFTSAQQGAGTGNFNAATNTLSVAPISSTAVQTNPSASTVSAPPKTTPVVTSQAAQDDYNEKLANFNRLITNLEAHTTAKNQAQAESQAKQAQDDLNKSKINLEQQGIDIKKSEADTKAKALTLASDTGSTPPQASTTPVTSTNGTDTVQTANANIQNANTSNDTAQNDIINQKTQAFTNFQQQVSQIMTGTFPLSAPEQALISSVQASLERQKASVVGVETEAAARSGQEYTPAQAAGMIANKVMDLDNMAAGTIAQLKLAFEKQDYQMINDTYDKQTKLLDDKSLAIQKLHDTVVANEKDIRDQAQKAQERADKLKQDDITNNLNIEKYRLDVSNSAVDNKYKMAEISKIYDDMKSADVSSAASWVKNIQSGVAKLSDVPKNLKDAVSAGLANGNPQGVNSILFTTQQALKTLNDYVDNNHGFSAAVGAKGITGSGPLGFFGQIFGYEGKPIAGTAAADFDAKLKQVVNDVVLPNLTILHGLGRVTDREFQSLQSSITSLNPNLSESEFKTELKKITDAVDQKVVETTTHNGIALPPPQTQTVGTYNGITLPN